MRYIAGLIFVLCITSCAYNSEEDLYPENNGVCDTADVSFANDVSPILDDHCITCHNSSSPPLGISLDSYAEVKEVAETSRLLGAIKHQSGYTPMPQNAPKLEKCTIATIEAWINDGMPDN